MSLTPDYFISNCGYPKLNREKYKLSSVIKQQQQQQHQQQQRKSGQLITATNNLIDTRNTRNVLKFNCCDMIFDNNSRILLTKRRLRNNTAFVNNVDETTTTENIRHDSCNCNYNSVNNNNNNNNNSDNNIIEYNNWNWVSDKEMKCFVNERIKENHKKYNRKELDKQQKDQNPYHNNNVR